MLIITSIMIILCNNYVHTEQSSEVLLDTIRKHKGKPVLLKYQIRTAACKSVTDDKYEAYEPICISKKICLRLEISETSYPKFCAD